LGFGGGLAGPAVGLYRSEQIAALWRLVVRFCGPDVLDHTIIEMVPIDRAIIEIVPVNRAIIEIVPVNRAIIEIVPIDRTIIEMVIIAVRVEPVDVVRLRVVVPRPAFVAEGLSQEGRRIVERA
jgi:hypothetical protein